MGYKIEYSPEYKKIKLHERKAKLSSLMVFLVAGLLAAGVLLYGREEIISAVAALEQMAGQIKQGDSAAEVFDTFSQALQGVFGG